MNRHRAHHTITAKGGRIASREKRHPFKTVAKTSTGMRPQPFPFLLVMAGLTNGVLLVTGRERVLKTREQGQGM